MLVALASSRRTVSAHYVGEIAASEQLEQRNLDHAAHADIDSLTFQGPTSLVYSRGRLIGHDDVQTGIRGRFSPLFGHAGYSSTDRTAFLGCYGLALVQTSGKLGLQHLGGPISLTVSGTKR